MNEKKMKWDRKGNKKKAGLRLRFFFFRKRGRKKKKDKAIM